MHQFGSNLLPVLSSWPDMSARSLLLVSVLVSALSSLCLSESEWESGRTGEPSWAELLQWWEQFSWNSLGRGVCQCHLLQSNKR